MKNKVQLFITILFLGFIGWWISFQRAVGDQGASVNWFENTYGLVALAGSIVGLLAMKKWGGRKTVLGKALLFFALGLFAQEAGQLISSYYTQVAKTGLPYPSIGDMAYFGSVILYICATYYLANVVGVKFSFKKPSYKIVAFTVPLVILAVSYTALLHNHQYDTTKPLTVFLDAGYPVGQATYISITVVAFLLSLKLMGGIMKRGFVFVVLALVVQYLADFTFIYQSHQGSYVPGKYDDLLYLVSYFAMASAMAKFLDTFNKLNSGRNATVLNVAGGKSDG